MNSLPLFSGKQDVCPISDANKEKGANIQVDQNKVFWMIFNGHLEKIGALVVETLKIISPTETLTE